MIDLDAIEQFARLNTFDPEAEASDAKAKRPDADELLALVRVTRAALLVEKNAWLAQIGYDDEAYRRRQAAADAFYSALAPFRKDAA